MFTLYCILHPNCALHRTVPLTQQVCFVFSFFLNPGRREETVNGYFHKNVNSLLELEGPGDKL